ncbi:MAG: DedA family protein [Candidatus Spechtbacteria bacterium SB0662_bin_43]|uniref:DedA family protein n=1 Tax=Candidatus Spechtbacteria bacterium SB0662_bin_43 TaxID=2604897 RepID=A0A845DC14_9BACT|nr:DedA family protein [Candidatus Spechtbacteria bacterium SB0662_bin_43]
MHNTIIHSVFLCDILMVVMLQGVVDFCINIVERGGYEGIFFGMFLEGTVLPLPIEEVMLPFAGFLAFSGAMSFWLIVFIGSGATTLGNLMSYGVARYWGTPFLTRYGKYCFIREKELRRGYEMFEKHGATIVFFGRFVPGVRGILPFIAGASRMNVALFGVFTFLGSFVSVFLFVFIGWYLGEQWERSVEYTQYISYIVFALVVLGIAFLLYKFHKNKSLREKVTDTILNGVRKVRR